MCVYKYTSSRILNNLLRSNLASLVITFSYIPKNKNKNKEKRKKNNGIA